MIQPRRRINRAPRTEGITEVRVARPAARPVMRAVGRSVIAGIREPLSVGVGPVVCSYSSEGAAPIRPRSLTELHDPVTTGAQNGDEPRPKPRSLPQNVACGN